MPSAPRSRARAASSGASTFASSRIGDAVLRDRGQTAEFVQRLLVRLEASPPGADLREGLLVRLQPDVACRAVDRHQRAGRDHRAGVVQPGDRRHADRPRQDCGVIGPAAGVGDERGQPGPVELSDHRRRDLVGDQHQWSVEAVEQVCRIARGPQVHAQPADDVGDVALSLAQVGVLDAVEERRDLLERPLQRRLRIQPFLAHDRRRPIDEHGIVQHQELGVEQVGVLVTRPNRPSAP